MRRALALLLIALPASAHAQSATDALAAQWNTICITAPDYSDLYQRCHETLASPDPLANAIAAEGQHLEEIPGQARVATRDQAPRPGAVRVDLGGNVNAWSSTTPDGGFNLDAEQALAPNWSIFLSADTGRIRRAPSPNEAAFKADTWSLTAGVDWRPAARWQVGAALSHARENLDYRDSVSTMDSRFTGLLLFASRELGEHWLLHGYLGSLRGGYDLSRDIQYSIVQASGVANVQATALADPDTRRHLGGLALNRAWYHGSWQGSLELGLDLARTWIDAYSERGGSGLALSLPQREVSTRRGRIDFQAGHTRSFGWGIWQPSVGLGWRREFANARRPLGLTLVEDVMANEIRFETEDPDNSWGEISLASAFTFASGQSAFFEVRQRVAHQFLDERLLSVGWRIELP